MLHTDADWQPTEIIQIGEAERTSTGVTRVLTDAGWAFCKPLGNRQGPHVLACEWVCIRLARWFGLPTFAAAIVELRPDMDHTHCFDNGVLSKNLARIDVIQDDAIYGRFPRFVPFLDANVVKSCAAQLAVARESTLRPFVDELPHEWQVDGATRNALVEMLWRRADYLAAQKLKVLLFGDGNAV
jgi:hypothetical protein